MKQYYFIPDQEIYNTLSALAYRIADNAYMLERYGCKDCALELAENEKTISSIFADLDRLRVPFWVQNAVICYSENWRNYKTNYLYHAFDKYKNNNAFIIDFSKVSCL